MRPSNKRIKTEILAIIPARGGSKRLPNKNIKPLAGLPLISYSIRSCQRSSYITRTVVSTEDKHIAAIAQKFGAEVIPRPKRYATDTATVLSVLKHVVKYLKDKENYNPDVVITMQPVCPFRKGEFIDRAIQIFLSSEADSLITVSEVKLKIGEISEGWYFPRYREGIRKQDVKSLYKENGVLYITRRPIIMDRNSIFGKKIKPMVTDSITAINIDDQFDFDMSEFVIKKYKDKFKELISCNPSV